MKRKRKRNRVVRSAEHRWGSSKPLSGGKSHDDGPSFTLYKTPHNVLANDKRRAQSIQTELSVNMHHIVDFDAGDMEIPADIRRIFDEYYDVALSGVVSPDFKYRAAAIYHNAIRNVPEVMARLEMMPFMFTWIEETSYIRLWMLAEWRDRDVFYVEWRPDKGSGIPAVNAPTLTLTSEMHLPDDGFWRGGGVFEGVSPMNHRNFCQFAGGCINDMMRIGARDIGGSFAVIAPSDKRWLGDMPYHEPRC